MNGEKICKYRECDQPLTKDQISRGILYCHKAHQVAEHTLKQRVYHAKHKKKYPPLQKLCPCGCWNFFFFHKYRPQRKYFKAYPCRHIHYSKMWKKEKRKVHAREVAGKPSFCHIKGITSGKVACADYSECLDGAAIGIKWPCSDGVNRFRKPGSSIKTGAITGGSFGICVTSGWMK